LNWCFFLDSPILYILYIMHDKLAKDVTNEVIKEFEGNSLFDNPFMDKFKFKSRLFKALKPLSEIDAINKLDSIVNSIYKDVFDGNLRNTIDSLVDRGLLIESENDNGETTYSVDEDSPDYQTLKNNINKVADTKIFDKLDKLK